MTNIKARILQSFRLAENVAVIAVIALTMQFCGKLSKSFYVDSLNVSIDIEELRKGMYRVYIYKSLENKGDDFIDINYIMSEMPSITLSFPLDGSNDLHVIANLQCEVGSYNSTYFNIIYPESDPSGLGAFDRSWCDSVMFDIPSISVQLDSYLRDLAIWNEDSKYLGKIYPYK